MIDTKAIAKIAEPFFGGPVEVEVHTDIIITNSDGDELGMLEDVGDEYQIRINGEFKGYMEKPAEIINNQQGVK